MKVFKCDRCGKYYDGCGKCGTKFLSLSIPEPQFRDDVQYFDLCDDCFNDAKKWLEVKDEEESEDGSISN